MFIFKVTGQQLRQMLHYMLREEAYTGHTEFYQLPSTLRLRYDRRKGDFDYFTYCGKEVGKEIGDDALFTVGLQNYHFKNIKGRINPIFPLALLLENRYNILWTKGSKGRTLVEKRVRCAAATPPAEMPDAVPDA